MAGEYERIERAIGFIQKHLRDQPSLEEVASHVGLSTFHCQRMFRRWAGVSPKRFLEYLTVDHAKKLLMQSTSILDASHELGLTSPARLHDQFISIGAVTPGEYKSQGRGIEIAYGIHESPFGDMLLAQTWRGICLLAFINQETQHAEIDALYQTWPYARIEESPVATAATAERVFNISAGDNARIHLNVRGTNFQINVWRALLKIPQGAVLSYRQVAQYLGKPQATRAVARAVASNPVSYLIPCHRVIRSTGALGGYRWGLPRKQLMLVWESEHSQLR